MGDLDRNPDGGFFGRTEELARLKTLWNQILSGDGTVAMLAGEPGIGKTRLGDEMAAFVQISGGVVLRGHTYEDQGVPPYWLWSHAIQGFINRIEPETLRNELGVDVRYLTNLIPGLRDTFPDNPNRQPEVDPVSARFGLYNAVVAVLTYASRSQPLLLILEDLNWSDEPSLLLLEHVARELDGIRMLLLGTYRDVELGRTHPLSTTLADLRRDRLFERITLRGLSRNDVRDFMACIAGEEQETALFDQVYDRTDGNPLFVEEIVRGRIEERGIGGYDNSDGLWVPEGVREAIGKRLNRLPAMCNDALGIAAVMGREFDPALLAKLIDEVADEAVIAGLEPAENAGLIEECGGTAGRYRFVHSLIQETLAEEMSTIRRIRLHARIGVLLETHYGDRAEEHVAELAFHFSEAEAVSGPEKVASYSLSAGNQSLDLAAYEEAARHFEKGIEATEGREMDSGKAGLLVGLAKARDGMWHGAKIAAQVFPEVFDWYIEAGQIDRAVEVASGSVFVGYGVETRPLRTMSEKALNLVPSDSIRAGRLLVQYAYLLFSETAEYDNSRDALLRAIDIAVANNDRGLESRARSILGWIAMLSCDWATARSECEAAIDLRGPGQDIQRDLYDRYVLLNTSLVSGDSVGVQEQTMAPDRLDSWWRRYRSHHVGWGFVSQTQYAYALSGDWETAEEVAVLAEKNPGYLKHFGVFCSELWSACKNDADNREQRLQAFVRFVGEIAEYHTSRMRSDGYLAFASIVLAEAAGRHADDKLLSLAENSTRLVLGNPGIAPLLSMTCRAGLALVATERNDERAAAASYGELTPIAGILLWPGTHCGDQILGLTARTMGALDCAVRHFEDALTFCSNAGYRTLEALSLLELSETLLMRKLPGDVDTALIRVEEGLAIATKLGMLALSTRLRELQRAARNTAPPAPAYPDQLTKREVEVIASLATGRTNQEIADGLFISQKTVENHITRILAKTGLRNRTEAAAYALQKGMIETG